jgi:hypothetical protein
LCVLLYRLKSIIDISGKEKKLICHLLFQMQDCGLPPKDLVGDLGPMVAFDEHGHPRMPMPGFGLGADPSERSSM